MFAVQPALPSGFVVTDDQHQVVARVEEGPSPTARVIDFCVVLPATAVDEVVKAVVATPKAKPAA